MRGGREAVLTSPVEDSVIVTVTVTMDVGVGMIHHGHVCVWLVDVEVDVVVSVGGAVSTVLLTEPRDCGKRLSRVMGGRVPLFSGTDEDGDVRATVPDSLLIESKGTDDDAECVEDEHEHELEGGGVGVDADVDVDVRVGGAMFTVLLTEPRESLCLLSSVNGGRETVCVTVSVIKIGVGVGHHHHQGNSVGAEVGNTSTVREAVMID